LRPGASSRLGAEITPKTRTELALVGPSGEEDEEDGDAVGLAGRGRGSGPPGLAGDRPALNASEVAFAHELPIHIRGTARRPRLLSGRVGTGGALAAAAVEGTAEEGCAEAVFRPLLTSVGALVEGAGDVVVVSIREVRPMACEPTRPREPVSGTGDGVLELTRVGFEAPPPVGALVAATGDAASDVTDARTRGWLSAGSREMTEVST
jgi:hypothetical protein